MKSAWDDPLRRAVALEYPYGDRPLGLGTPSAVLVLFSVDDPDDPAVLLTRRAESLVTHKGQIAFPGGVKDPEDDAPEITALRETEEEVGIDRGIVRIMGRLPELSTTTGFLITPVVSVLTVGRDDLSLKANPDEIAEAFWVPVSVLNAEGTYRRELFPFGGNEYPIDVFQVGKHRIWGATGSILKNLLDRLRSLG